MVDGPSSGITKYGPEGTPHQPSVWPKSSLCFSSPISVATSAKPRKPSVELTKKRAVSDAAALPLPCNRLLKPVHRSPRFEKKLPTTNCTGLGVMKRYALATGLSAYWSARSLKANITRL